MCDYESNISWDFLCYLWRWFVLWRNMILVCHFVIGVMLEQKADWNRNQKLQQGGHKPGKIWKPGTAPNFRPMSIVAKLSPIWAAAEHLFVTMPGDWLGRLSPKWPVLCRVGRTTLTQSIIIIIGAGVGESWCGSCGSLLWGIKKGLVSHHCYDSVQNSDTVGCVCQLSPGFSVGDLVLLELIQDSTTILKSLSVC